MAARINSHPGGHSDRDRFVSSDHPAIFTAYLALKTASRIARYGTLHQFRTAYPGTTVQDVLIDKRLVAIETYVDVVFSPPAPPATGAAGS